MAKAEWGLKRICHGCTAHFYDLKKSPILCPKCGDTFDPELSTRGRRRGASKDAPSITLVELDPTLDANFIDPDLLESEGTEGVDDDVMEDASDLGGEEELSDVMEHVEHEGKDN